MTQMTFLGDIFPADEFFTMGFGIKSKTTQEQVKLWAEDVGAVVGSADYVVGNLESPLVDDSHARRKTFYGRPLFADVLKKSGVNVLNIANNHIAEHGEEGFRDTVSTLAERGLSCIGALREGQAEILSLCHDSTKICMAAFCDERVCAVKQGNCYADLTEADVFTTLERMRSLLPDVIILVFHWGNEYVHFPSLQQRKFAYELIERGADVIIGHHPHVIQPYEQYKNGHIIYSLGNFCFDDVQSGHFGKGMIARVMIEDKAVSKITFSGVLVQDMAYSDTLVKPMPDNIFETYFTKINTDYDRLRQLPPVAYEQAYTKVLRRAHTKERLWMRLSLLKKVFDIRHQHKAQLLRNIKQFIA